MFGIRVNKQLFLLKMSFFYLLGTFGPIVGFLPTIARQLGYSVTAYGTIMMVMSIISTILVPLTGIIVDKFHVKKILFLTSIILLAVTSFLFLFVPNLPSDQYIELECNAQTVFTISNENDLRTTSNKTIFTGYNIDELITCKLDCRDDKPSHENLNQQEDPSHSCDEWMATENNNDFRNEYKQIVVTFKLKDTEQMNTSYIFHILSAQKNGTKTLPTSCQCRLKQLCRIDYCSNNIITDLTNTTTYKGNILILYQFWIFFSILGVYIICAGSSHFLINTICLDTLGNKSEDYGKQKCWGSVGWGFFSIFIGWLVDVFSVNKKDKDYSPIFYSSVMLSLCNFSVSTKIKVIETKKSNDKFKTMYGLFTKHTVIAFLVWSTFSTFFHTIITHYLFWYMEDLVVENNDDTQRKWLKTLQGLTQGIQCFAGEIPFFFWSGWIIRKIGHVNCMALSLGTTAIRMYLYTVISNPTWIILIEILNGVSYALGLAVKMSYSKIMSPPDTMNSVIGFLGFFDHIGDSLGSFLGGYLFGLYGGLWSFRFFAYGSALMCCLNILTNWLGVTKDLETTNVDTTLEKADESETNVTNKQM